jgi:ZU5 domain
MRRFLLALSTVSVAAIAACMSDSPVSPPSAPAAAPASANASLLGLGGATVVTPLHRTKALSQSLSASATVGPLGGTLSIPAAGVLVVVPPLALSSTQKITITAVAGSNVAYEFAPHGLKFNVPLVVTQNLGGTDAASSGSINPLSLFAGYYPDSTNITSITERLNVNLNLLNQLATFSVWHFSGYILASGGDE